MDIVNKLQELIRALNGSIRGLNDTGYKYATAYKNYRIALAKELIRLKDNGMPVTIAYDIARGNEYVAELKFKEISSEAIYKANLEAINAIKLQIKVLENQYDKEYNNIDND